jgi:carbonic anhydrase
MKNDPECEVLVVSCIDFRFITKVRDFLISLNLTDKYDLITIPGASLNINNIAASINTSIKLHNPTQIHVFDHEDCGAYGEDNSRENHTENLRKAKKILSNQCPGKLVKTYIAGFNQIEE